MVQDLTAFVEQLRALAASQSRERVTEELADILPEDLAEGVVRLDTEEAVDLLKLLGHELAANVLIELPTATTRSILQELPDYTVAHFLDVLPMDDALDLREELGAERFNDLLEVIPDEDAQEIRRLMTYPEDSVGRLMTERFFEVAPETTMAALLDDIRKASDEKYETVNDVYVLDPERKMLGIFSLRRALRAKPSTKAGDIMRDEVITVQATDDAEEAARRMSRYGFYGLPVLDANGRMVGLFTGDDAQEILEEATTADLESLGAVSGPVEAYLSLSVWKLAWKRIPWLLGLFVAEMLTGLVMRHYANVAPELKITALMFFVPLLIGAGGNSGSQVTTMVTRALAVGEVRPRDWLTIVSREFLTACLVGLTLGVAGYARAIFWGADPKLCLLVGIALPCIVIWSTVVGSVLPLGAKRAGIDPAVMSAPFISTFVDATGLIIYFQLALAMKVVG
ncbi:MAG: magnesium transporter [Chthonomonas sp.]|nr:magnesium transporter [Chthonomonas sp.]